MYEILRTSDNCMILCMIGEWVHVRVEKGGICSWLWL